MHPLDPTVVERLHLQIVSAPKEVESRTSFTIGVRLDNDSDEVINSNFPCPVQLGHRWHTSSDLGDYVSARTRLFPWAMPHSHVAIPMLIEAPARAGVYKLTVAAVQEFVRWFDHPHDALAQTIDVRVVPRVRADIGRQANT
jgi:hypothetical protein